MAKKEEKPQQKAVAEELTPGDKKVTQAIEKIIENREISPADAFGKMTRQQIELIKRTIAKGASDDELKLFIQVCKGAQLNPFLKQVHLVPRWDSKDGKEVRAIQVSIDGFRSIAESSGAYAGNDDPIYEGEHEIEYGPKERNKVVAPNSATVTVYKIVCGNRYAFTATARWAEYYPGERIGFQWHVRPYLMLGKCAEALALRKAFPKLLSGMYAQEEMDRTSVEDESQKAQKGFEKLMEVIGKSTLKELEEYKSKMEKSDKYTPKQKEEFLKAVKDKIAEWKEIKKQESESKEKKQ